MKEPNPFDATLIKTRGQMSHLVREIAGLKLDEKFLLADLDRELRDTHDRYEKRLRKLARIIEQKTSAARAWADTNPHEFGRRRSVDFGHGVAGFRTGPPRLQTVSRCQWDRVLRRLRAATWGAPYVRVKEEINKERIISDIGAGKLSEKNLRQAGAQIVRDENFFVEPKLARPRRKPPAA
jgi:phage host-nuclease inhibitor protein Gam